MWWDQKFTPEKDGDPYERLWWHFLKMDFPAWATFWAHHCVPLTNRIDDNSKQNDQARLFIRDDPKISKGIEALVMRNYSVFYYLARSCAIVASEPHLFTEDAFIFLRAATENTQEFLKKTFEDRLAKKLDINQDDLPDWKKIRDSDTAKEILHYRDAYVHFARLGRHPNLSWEFIPNHSHISPEHSHVSQAKNYWSNMQKLPEKDFINSRQYLKELQTKLMKELNPVWERITHLLDQSRTNEKYFNLYRLCKDASGKYRPIK
ncbi:MAG: hypothetical protein ACREC9_06285 [Methylocella sp.]